MRLVGFVVGSDYPPIQFGALLELCNTHALAFNRPGAFLCGCYSPSDVIEYHSGNGQTFSTTAGRKLALVRPEHVVGRWDAAGLHPVADRVFVALDPPPVPASAIVAPEPWLKRACTGTVQLSGELCPIAWGRRVMAEPETGTDLQMIDGRSLLSVRYKDLILEDSL